MTSDNRVIHRNTIERYGNKAISALNDLLMEEVIMPLADDTYTTGRIRAVNNLDFYRICSKSTIDNFPWDLVKNEADYNKAGLRFGNICVPKESSEELIADIISLSKKVARLEERALKLPHDKVSNMTFLTMAFDTNTEEDNR